MGASEIISLLGGIALFLFGMAIMGDGLKKVAGSKLELVLYKLTSTPLKGVLLGTGGLVRAYTTATARALENAEVVTVRSVVELQVTVDYALYERASLLIDAAGAKQAPPEFTDRVTLRWQMPEHTEAPLLEQLRELTRGSAQVTVSDPFYAPF